MRENEALFTLYRYGWRVNLVPRGLGGWLATLAWLIGYAPIVGLYTWFLTQSLTRAQAIAALLLFLLATLGWSIALTFWAKQHSVAADPAQSAAAKPVEPSRSGAQAWFAPKRFGYGAGHPIAWQGWALLATYLGSLGFAGWLDGLGSDTAKGAALGLFFAATVLFVSIVAKRTAGGWKWRWGERD